MPGPRAIKMTSVRRATAKSRVRLAGTPPSSAIKGKSPRGPNGLESELRCSVLPLRRGLSNTDGRFAAAKDLPWPIEMVSLAHLRQAVRKTRTHSKKQIAQLVESMRDVDCVEPVIVDEELRIIGGHARVEAAEQAGFHSIPVIIISGLSTPRKRALSLRLNKIGESAGWDRPMLAIELQELAVLLPEINLDLSLTGFEPAEIDALLGDLSDGEADPADDVPAPERRAISKRGDLWGLGPNRLLCGDAKAEADYRTLMQRERATALITDCPFNLKIRSIVGRGRTKHREFFEGSGEKTSAQFTDFLTEFMELAAKYSVDGSLHYLFIDWRHLVEMSTAGNNVYGELKNLVVWAKTNAGQGSFYRSQHELIFVFKNGQGPHVNNVELGKYGRSRSNVWSGYAGANTFRSGRLEDLAVHPTVKPVALIADAMRDCTRRGDIVLDPFIGSGTTILAAERVGRRGYGIEIDPVYVDVAIRRWQAFTKQDAILKSTGQTFDEVVTERLGKGAGKTR